jgi:hypothetical protein
MKVSIVLLGLAMVGCVFAIGEHERRKPEHVEREKERDESVKEKPKISESDVGKGKFKLDERSKDVLLKEKVEAPHVVIQKTLEYFLQNPNRIFERECFSKIDSGESIDFVIDLAPSPALDKADRLSAQNPIAYFLDLKHQTPSPAYFNSIEMFINAVTFQMKPETTHSIIYDNRKKYFIRGKLIDAPVTHALNTESGEFVDSKRNLKTMWPVPTKSVPETFLHAVLKNNLGRMTKLALWNRDNGLPTVLAASRRSKPIYTIVISDGASGAKLDDLTDDISRTTVIDIGNRRFVKNIDWEDMRQLVSVVTLSAPQQLPTMVDTCRLIACRACGCI